MWDSSLVDEKYSRIRQLCVPSEQVMTVHTPLMECLKNCPANPTSFGYTLMPALFVRSNG